jgi:tetratricopeptide (TPR) repeat protein/ferredoxin
MRKRKSKRCDVAVDTANSALPVAGRGQLSHVRKSTNGKWRAIVLLSVHLLVAAHVTHFVIAGRTLSPVEPSEAMYTLELGQLNAGFIFLIVALLATLVFGRFFCGWGCHIVALQDLCGWIMKQLGVRPKPFRSRLLVYVPLALACYMFVWPTLRRLVIERPAGSFPGFTDHLMTTSFWATFPGPLFAVLTFLSCGFVAVYLLGAKGFCTYGCPYGGLFVLVDRLSPGRIVVDDSCEQCGHCTVTCTSNVLIHEEVRLYGQVVDPGCMKCMDCVTVCPKGALSFSFAKPSLFKQAPVNVGRARRFALSMGEESVLAVVCVGSILAFYQLYAVVPLLMSAGLGGITAFVSLKLWQLLRKSDVRLQNLKLKNAGGIRRSGWIFAGLAVLWLSFTVHSAFIRWHGEWADYHLNRTEASREDVLSGAFRDRTYSERHARAAERSFRHFTLADRWGLFDVGEIKRGLAWSHLLRGEDDAAVARIREAISLAPNLPQLHDDLVELLLARRQSDAAVGAMRNKIASVEPTGKDQFRLAGLLVEAGRFDEAVEHYASSVALTPDNFQVRHNFGGTLRRLGRYEEAIEELRVAARLEPTDAATQVELGLAYQAAGDKSAALQCFKRAIELDPDSPESRLHLPNLIAQLEQE